MLVCPSSSSFAYPFQTFGACAELTRQPGQFFYGYHSLSGKDAGYSMDSYPNWHGGDCAYDNRKCVYDNQNNVYDNRKFNVSRPPTAPISPPVGMGLFPVGSHQQPLYPQLPTGLPTGSPGIPCIMSSGNSSESSPCTSPGSPTNCYVCPVPGPLTDAMQPTPTNRERTRTREKYRVVYSEKQRVGLEKEYKANKFITTQCKVELSRTLDLSERQIKIWFQNRRAKERKQRRRQDEAEALATSTSSLTSGTCDEKAVNSDSPASTGNCKQQTPYMLDSFSSPVCYEAPMTSLTPTNSNVVEGNFSQQPNHRRVLEQPSSSSLGNLVNPSTLPVQYEGSVPASCLMFQNSHTNDIDSDVLGSAHHISDMSFGTVL